jgi:hypothetical protein
MENKVTAQHLQRSAYLYVRQSTLRQPSQVADNSMLWFSKKCFLGHL